jgi:drug/metabolite transporter (DMT)-like permease
MKDDVAVSQPFPGSEAEVADWSLLVVPGMIWGASFLFIAEGMRSIGPNGVTFVRILIGFVTLSLFPSARKSVMRSDWTGIVGLGVLWLAFPLSMFPFAEQRVSSALTGMLNGANPLFTAIVASAITRHVPPRRMLAGVAVGMAGAILMALPTIGEGHSSAPGVGMIMAALVSYGFALNIARPLQQRNGALPVIWRAQMVALVLTAPLGLPDMVAARWRTGPVVALLALGTLGTGVAHAIMSVAAGRLGATRASGTTLVIPAVALILGVVVRGEKVALLSVVGSGVCIAGAWLMRRAQSSREQQDNTDLRGQQQPVYNARPGSSDFQELQTTYLDREGREVSHEIFR